ncbi:MAG: Cna B-type domain-containing protein, partial [Oscillospiraceae bacterium]|nr:Cna B-type domain-containing protein [Oscillospiraceae bacterium]
DYNGGKPVQYTVNKTWDFDGENDVYPDIKVALTQSFQGKDANGQAAEILFNTYEARLTEANGWSYTFGEQEDLREYAPNGTPFQYAVHEVLSNYDPEEDPVELSADGDQGLGFVYSSTETCIMETVTPDTGDAFERYHYTKYITNTYDPKKENFQGELAVSKAWDNKDKETENPENENEFGTVKGYTFTLSRRTRKIAAQSLFTLTTRDNYEGDQTPELTPTAGGPVTVVRGFALSDEGKFVANLSLDGNPVTVTVDLSNNGVQVDGLAIYARDAVRYDYTVAEDNSNPAYLPVSPLSHRLTDPDAFALSNVLNTTDLRVNKRFGASVNGEIAELDYAHFCQFFNEDYLKSLELTLYRKTEDESDWNKYLTQSGQDGEGALTLTLEAENDQYYYVFRDLPKYSAEGEAYQYRLSETKNGGTLVTTQYRDAEDAYQSDPSPLTPPDSDEDETPSLTVRNSFPARAVTLRKIWDDRDNADGMRDSSVDYLVCELVPEDPGPPTEIEVGETVSAAEDWETTIPLPLYYFNGRVIDGLKFKLDETMSENMIRYRYVLDTANSDETYGEIPDDGILRLTNQKEQVNGSITLTKTWAEDDPWGLQPDTVYFKLYRRCYDSGGVFSEAVGENSTDPDAPYSLIEGQDYAPVTEDTLGTAVGDAATHVIAVTRDAGGVYALTLEHLPIGVVSDSGQWYGYLYRFVECDAQGNEYTRRDMDSYSDSGDHFSYSWDYASGVWETADDEGMHLAVDDTYQAAHRDQGIANSLKLTSYRFEKTWNDENNLYGTRRPITVQLQRRLATQTEETDWTPVDVQSAAPTPDENGLDHWTAARSGETDEAVQQVCASGNTQSGVFDGLPIYNKDGIAYEYRVKELKIGDIAIVDETYNGHPATKTFDYYLNYNSNSSVTEITNNLIVYEPSQHYLAEKIWEDNGNQDGKRPDHLNVYLVQSKAEGKTPASVQTFLGVLNEANGWKYQWENYPAFAENGDTYTYSMQEDSIDSYTLDHRVYSKGTIPDAPADRNKWEQNSYTNGHTQAVRSLTVDKDWLNELENEKCFRPASLTYELCCKYTTYRYASYDPVEIVADSSYDGPISGATALLARYPDATWEGAYDADSHKVFHYTKTLTPEDRTDDEAWDNAVTFHNLPVYLNTCGDGRWNGKEVAVEYYIREVEDPTAGDWNPYLYGVSSIDDTAGTGQSSHTTLQSGSAAADQTVTVQNKFKKREIVVTKVWEDQGYGTGLHYDIDFTLDCTGSDSGYSYHATETLSVGQTSVSFPDLPIFDQNGQILTYTLTETVSGSTAANKYGYQQSQTVSYHGDGAERFVTVFTVTNTLPVVRLSADKYWNDNQNQDGKRPEQLDFTLTGTAEGTADISLTRSDGSTAHASDSSGTHWGVDFGVQPRYNANNVAYVYSVTEAAHSGDTLAARGYVRYVTEGGSTAYSATITDGLSDPSDPAYGQVETTAGTMAFHFQNRYSPETDALAVKKQWNDAVAGVYDLAALTRPESVTVTLWCKYGDEDPVELAQAAADHPVKQLFPNGYAFSRTVRSSEDWIKLFENLPRSVNPNGTATFNGQSYPIVYSVTEEVPTGYKVRYSAPTALTDGADDRITVTNTLEQRSIPVTKVWDDGGLSADALHYDIDFTLSYSGDAAGVSYSETKTLAADAQSRTVIFEDVPLYDKDGHAIPYTVTERVHNGSGATAERKYGYTASQTLMPASPDADHPLEAVTVTNTLPKTLISVSKTWDDAANVYALRPSEIHVQLERRTVTDNGTAWASAEDGWANCGGEAAIRGDTWSHTYAALPKFDANNIPYEYRVTEAKVNAYDTAYLTETGSYQAAPVVKADSASGDNSVIGFGVKNTLITEPLTLIKIWDDSGCTQSGLHYPVTFAVSNGDTSRISFQTVPYVLDINETHTTGSADNWRRTTAALPVYYRDGTPILYTVTET